MDGYGHFGYWITDPYGHVAYDYTCQQYELKEEMPLTGKDGLWSDYREHYSQIGNHRLTALTSNFGTIKLRQDEGAPKFLNERYPQADQYSGGFGYLKCVDGVLATYYTGGKMRRIFGQGYFLKETANSKFHVKQLSYVPDGDDPVLISTVTITNNTEETQKVSWYEYWGTQKYQFSYRPFNYTRLGGSYGTSSIGRGYRFDFEKNFRYHVTKSADAISIRSTFEGYRYPEGLMAAMLEKVPGDAFEDLHEPTVYLCALTQADSLSLITDTHAFFQGDVSQPAFGEEEGHDAMIIRQDVTLERHSSYTLAYLVGYETTHQTMTDMRTRYQPCWQDIEKLFHEDHRISFDIAGDSWVGRENEWHQYMLSSSVTYDHSFSIISLIRTVFISMSSVSRDLPATRCSMSCRLSTVIPISLRTS